MELPTVAQLWSMVLATIIVFPAAYWVWKKEPPPHWMTLVVFVFAIPFVGFGTGSHVKIDVTPEKVEVDIAELEEQLSRLGPQLAAFRSEIQSSNEVLFAGGGFIDISKELNKKLANIDNKLGGPSDWTALVSGFDNLNSKFGVVSKDVNELVELSKHQPIPLFFTQKNSGEVVPAFVGHGGGAKGIDAIQWMNPKSTCGILANKGVVDVGKCHEVIGNSWEELLMKAGGEFPIQPNPNSPLSPELEKQFQKWHKK